MVTGSPVPVIAQTQEKMRQTLGLFCWLFMVKTRSFISIHRRKLLHMLSTMQKSLTAAGVRCPQSCFVLH